MTSADRSALFTTYNAAKPLVRDGARLNRALGIAQSSQPSKYVTTPTSCTCADRRYRGARCKHIIALALVEVAL